VTESKAGTGVELTIDRDVQWVAQDAISAAVKQSHAVSGTVVVMDPKTGQILAQASAPTFDPTKAIKDISVLRNPAVTDAYEPGSVGKIITYSAAMEEGKITPLTTLTIPYTLKVGGTPFHDHEAHATEVLTTTGALAISSNTGAIQVGAMLSNNTLYSYLQKFGIGQLTGSHLPGETQGLLHPVSTWSATSAPTIAFGQGYSVTALQATCVFATIANDGVRVTPNVVAGYFDPSGNFTASKPASSVRVVSSETATKMRLMMESVVTANGTAPEAAIPGYRVAGKTGTAMRSNGSGGYSGYTASFIGFAPADAPRYVVSVVVQAPQGVHFGGLVAGPVFKKVMSFVLQAKHIAPTAPSTIVYPLTESALKASGKVVSKSATH
jgi:cell division protein FtsI (penicillin-binding protein 3)